MPFCSPSPCVSLAFTGRAPTIRPAPTSGTPQSALKSPLLRLTRNCAGVPAPADVPGRLTGFGLDPEKVAQFEPVVLGVKRLHAAVSVGNGDLLRVADCLPVLLRLAREGLAGATPHTANPAPPARVESAGSLPPTSGRLYPELTDSLLRPYPGLREKLRTGCADDGSTDARNEFVYMGRTALRAGYTPAIRQGNCSE